MSKVLKETYLESLGVIVLSYERARELTRQLIEKGKLSSDREMVFITKLLETARNNTSLIIKIINEGPKNANQLATTLKMDYRTITHHLDVLQKNGLIIFAGEGYGKTYFLSPRMEENYALFEEILNKIWKKEKREEK